jgi:tRNA(Arg) A34 adenosine deaminase TadA
MPTPNDQALMTRAIDLSLQSVADGGGPFGCVIAKNGVVIATGTNQVTTANDPTAHAEIVAIRAACRALDDFTLRGCHVYTSCEPCPMCLAGLWWARVDRITYANGRADAAAVGFDDKNIYAELSHPPGERKLPLRQMMRDQALVAFSAWRAKADRVEY